MALIDFGGTKETVVTRKEFSMSRAHKVLKNAGYVPAEIEMLQQLAQLREQLSGTSDAQQQRELKVKIAKLQQKVTMTLEAMRRKR